MTIEQFNQLSPDDMVEKLLTCCGSRRWAEEMQRSTPFSNTNEIRVKAEIIWNELTVDDWLEAFSHHPRIGDLNSIKTRFAKTAEFSGREQAGVNLAPEYVLRDLAEKNKQYESKFGHVFLVCATGKSANEMLEILESRMDNEPEVERRIAGMEQLKITKLRLEKIVTNKEPA